MTLLELIGWFESTEGGALISDDAGNWACVFMGFQNVPLDPPENIQSSFFIEKKDWYPSIQEALQFRYNDEEHVDE